MTKAEIIEMVCSTCEQPVLSGVSHSCRSGPPTHVMGCICPPESNLTCQNQICPRKSGIVPITTGVRS